MKNNLLLAILCLVLTSSSPTQSRPRMFEVRVESKIDGCVRRHEVTVEAKNIDDARIKAQRVVQSKLTTRVTNTREIKRP
ncbi:hypothetical protein [Sphingobacterium lumbrici]|uniref:hypothetical protein n=1 Tax=Sphingobacterium lumbrici TaxID=2559600 RepID=UPI001126B102|nr:hypothetical protein [Sphingobacterium lumbrici]